MKVYSYDLVFVSNRTPSAHSIIKLGAETSSMSAINVSKFDCVAVGVSAALRPLFSLSFPTRIFEDLLAGPCIITIIVYLSISCSV